MKKITLLFALLLSATIYSQVAISPSYRGADEEFEKEDLNNFKKTTTVFVLSNVYKKAEYEKILKEVWTITPFIVVDYNDFVVNKYADGNYSIAKLFGDVTVSSKGTKYIHMGLNVTTIDPVKFKKDFEKLKSDDKHYSK